MNLSDFFLITLMHYTLYHGQAPTLAGVPPTTRVCCAFEYPQPSSGVSSRPFGLTAENLGEPIKYVNICCN